jgi:zinc transporter ZupT
MYERHAEPLLPVRHFLRRLGFHLLLGLAVLTVSLGIGILGYALTEGMPFLDALLNASMILGGMGPVDVLHTDAGKLFASIYALFAGMVFLVVAGIMVAPVAHRILHWMHVEDSGKEDNGSG